jgi:hypothetical protein
MEALKGYNVKSEVFIPANSATDAHEKGKNF